MYGMKLIQKLINVVEFKTGKQTTKINQMPLITKINETVDKTN